MSSCDAPINCFDEESKHLLKNKRFACVYVIGTRSKFSEKTGYRITSSSSFGIAGCINKTKKKLYILLDDDDVECSARAFLRKLVQLGVSCEEIEVKAVSTRSYDKIKGMARILKTSEDSSDSD